MLRTNSETQTKHKTQTPATPYRRLEAIAHEALNRTRYALVADLAEDVKRTAARQRIPYDGTEVSKALASVGSRRPLTRGQVHK